MRSIGVVRPIDVLRARVFEAVPAAEQQRWGAEWERLEAELARVAAPGKPVGDELLSDLTPILLGRCARVWAGGREAGSPVSAPGLIPRRNVWPADAWPRAAVRSSHSLAHPISNAGSPR